MFVFNCVKSNILSPFEDSFVCDLIFFDGFLYFLSLFLAMLYNYSPFYRHFLIVFLVHFPFSTIF